MNQDFRKTAPEALEPVAFNIPETFETELPNGLKIVLIEDENLPLISFRLAFQRGDIHDPANLIGINSAVAALLSEGTQTRDSRRIAEEIERLGANINANSSEDHTVISASALSFYSSDILRLLADMVLNPVFPENELKLYKDNTIEGLKFQRSEPGFLADEQMSRILYGEHPYSIVAPSPEDVGRLTREDLIAHHKANFAPDQAILIAVGDIDRQEFLNEIEDLFGSWAGKTDSDVEFPNPPERSEKTLTIVDRPGSAQSNIVLANLGIDRSNPDYFSVLVMNQVLGGGASARLFMNLREEKGYTYGAYSRFNSRRLAGDFEANAEVRTPVTGESLREFFFELDRIRSEEVEENELQDAKNYLIGTFPIRAETQGGLINLILTQKIYRLSDDYLQTYRENIQNVSPKDVLEAAKKYLHPEKIAMVIVGDAFEILPQVGSFAEKINVVDTDGNEKGLENYQRNPDAPTADVSGIWNLLIEIAGQSLQLSAEFTQDGENLSGKINSMLGSGEITTGRIEGDKLTANAQLLVQGQSLEIGLSAVVEGDSIKGTVNVPISPQPIPFSGNREN